jgi:hypothetical protein
MEQPRPVSKIWRENERARQYWIFGDREHDDAIAMTSL